MTPTPRLLLAAAVLAVVPASLAGQSSVYSVLGLGFPVEPMDARARSMGGGVAAFEPRSATNPAAVMAFRRLTVLVNTETLIRSYEVGDTDVTGLQETRFPFAMLGGNIPGLPVFFGLSYATYLDRTYDVTASDTVTVRGAPIPVTDRLRSRGAVTDVRGALAWSVSPRVGVGVGAHVLSGTARLTTRRSFDDPYYATLNQSDDQAFQGFGVSAGLSLAPTNGIRLGVAVRTDGALETSRDGEPLESFALPMSVSAGLIAFPSARVRWAATGQWRSWSDTQADLPDDRAFDTWFVGSGLEVSRVLGSAPVRLGARYELLPFSPTDQQPLSLTLALGTGVQFAQNRAVADITVERSYRDGGGAREQAWSLSAALVIVP